MSLRREVGLGLFWVALATVTSKGLSLLRKLILARLLVPDDFGLVGYASLAIGILVLFKEMGFSSALIYRKDDIEEAANTTFLAAIFSSILLYIIAWSTAPWLASFFRNPELTAIFRVLSLTLIISSISQVPLTLMAKGMGFKKKVIPEVIAGAIGSALSVVLAFMDYGVWSIIYGQLLTSILTSILVWFFCPWRPSIKFRWQVAQELWDYGRHIIGSQVLVFFITNIDDAFVGRFLGDAALGTYSLAYELSNLPATHLSRIVGQVMFPAFSKVQGNGQALRKAFFQSLKYVSLAAFPIAIITLIFAKDFIVVAYGSKWFRAVIPLQWLTIYGLARAIAVNMGNVFKVGGKPRWLVWIASWRLAVMAVFLYPAIKYYGVTGVAALSAIIAIIDFFLSMYLTNRIVQAPWRNYARILLPMLVTSVGTALFAHQIYLWLQDAIHPFLSLPLLGGLALALYLLIMYASDARLRHFVSRSAQTLVQEYRQHRAIQSQGKL